MSTLKKITDLGHKALSSELGRSLATSAAKYYFSKYADKLNEAQKEAITDVALLVATKYEK